MNVELERSDVETYLTWDSTSLDLILTAMDDDAKADYIADKCEEWIAKKLDELIEEYDKFMKGVIDDVERESNGR